MVSEDSRLFLLFSKTDEDPSKSKIISKKTRTLKKLNKTLDFSDLGESPLVFAKNKDR